MGVPADGLERAWVNELLGAAGSVLDAAAARADATANRSTSPPPTWAS
ncbi:hypothetical protein SMICM304S_01479 [Streptomyces microflavus]